MTSLPIEPYLVELLAAMDQNNCSLVIAGGIGIYLKRRWVVQQREEAGRRLLFEHLPLPDARATDDIDAFLNVQLFALPMRASFRGILTRLAYSPRTNFYQFHKPFRHNPELKVKLDLLAPRAIGDSIKVSKPPRIGPTDNKRSPPDEQLHAHVTPEAFAIEVGIQTLPLIGPDLDGRMFEGTVRVPHPYASLCMKIQAALDHESTTPQARDPRRNGKKHAFDVYLLLAMMSPEEHAQTRGYVQLFGELPEFVAIQRAVLELFRTPGSPGCHTIASNEVVNIDLDLFCASICELFAPPDA